MPLYSLIALVISLFGAAYTAIAALRTRFDPMITDLVRGAEPQLNIISRLGSGTSDNASEHAKRLRFWAAVWGWSHFIPILAFWLFAFAAAAWALVSWAAITTLPAVAAVSPSLSAAPSQSTLSSQPWQLRFSWAWWVVCVSAFTSFF